jgi:hypothetical protein
MTSSRERIFGARYKADRVEKAISAATDAVMKAMGWGPNAKAMKSAIWRSLNGSFKKDLERFEYESHAESVDVPRLRHREYLSESAADIILKQLGGGRRLGIMIGAKNFTSMNGGKSLAFNFPNRMRSKPNAVVITLTPKDLYDIEFRRVSLKAAPKTLKTYRDVYVDQLMDLFEKETGLYLTLSPRR